MKHLFLVHSPITYLVALKILHFEGLDNKDCIIITFFGFKVDDRSEGVNVYDLSYTFKTSFTKESFPFHSKFWRGRRKLWSLDRWIEKVGEKEKYTAYVPQTSIRFIKLILTHKLCAGFCLMEEGIGSYRTQEDMQRVFPDLPFEEQFLNQLNYGKRLGRELKFFDPAYLNVYGVTEHSFPGFPRKKVIGLPFAVEKQGQAFSNILVFDAMLEYGLIDQPTLTIALKKFMNWLMAKEIKELQIKYHPVQIKNEQSIRYYRNFFSEYSGLLTIREIEQTVVLEEVAFSSAKANLVYYIMFSSIGLYASFCGKKVYSFAGYIGEQNVNFANIIAELPKVFHEHVEFI